MNVHDVTATGAIANVSGGIVRGLYVVAGSAAATAVVYEGEANTGRVLGRCSAPANSTSPFIPLNAPFGTGLYVEVSGTGVHAMIHV
jgi:hypothetical protein